METKKIPTLISQFCSFYFNSNEEFKKYVIKQIREIVGVAKDYQENVVSNDFDPIVLGHIIPEKWLSKKSHFFIYNIFDFENVDQLIQYLNDDLSNIKNPDQDIIVKFVCDFKSKN
jgi:hypothetical protein